MWIKLGPPIITALGKNPPPEVLWPNEDQPNLSVALGQHTPSGVRVTLNGKELPGRITDSHWTLGAGVFDAGTVQLALLLVDAERGITADMLRAIAPPGVRIVEGEKD